MYKFLSVMGFFACMPIMAWANEILGDWKIIDDRSSTVLVKVRISQASDQSYEAHVLEAYPAHHQTIEDMKKYKNFLLLSKLKLDVKNPKQFYGGVAIDPITKTVHKNVTARLNTRATVLTFRGKSDDAIASRRLSWVKVE